MLNTTLSLLRCPRLKTGSKNPAQRRQGPKSPQHKRSPCRGALSLTSQKKVEIATSPDVFEVVSGHLECKVCRSRFPILAGIAILVDSVANYLIDHAKGIAQAVSDSEIPAEYRKDFLQAKAQIQLEHIEDDLEAERVVSLYIMNHYLQANRSVKGQSREDGKGEGLEARSPWWKPRGAAGSASSEGPRREGNPALQSGVAFPGSKLIDTLIREYWDQGPFAQIERWVSHQKNVSKKSLNAVELGCGVGGLYPVLKNHLRSYLGVDSSFVSIAVARHLALGMPYRGSIRIPEDLLQGPVSRPVTFPSASSAFGPSRSSGVPAGSRSPLADGSSDFIVGDLESLPLHSEQWDLTIALNAIDMMDDPSLLPQLQRELIKKDGIAIQSCPYIWHPGVAKRLRKKLPEGKRTSSSAAVEWLYEQAGFKIEERALDIPWLFFKHVRQLEIYSVHAFVSRKA